MSNEKNPFKSIEEKFLERQRAKQKATSRSKAAGHQIKPAFEFKKYVKLTITLTVIFAIIVILLQMCSS